MTSYTTCQGLALHHQHHWAWQSELTHHILRPSAQHNGTCSQSVYLPQGHSQVSISQRTTPAVILAIEMALGRNDEAPPTEQWS